MKSESLRTLLAVLLNLIGDHTNLRVCWLSAGATGAMRLSSLEPGIFQPDDPRHVLMVTKEIQKHELKHETSQGPRLELVTVTSAHATDQQAKEPPPSEVWGKA